MTSTQRARAIPTVCRCACGELVIGGGAAPGERRAWCATCVAFVEASIRAHESFTFLLPDEGIDLVAVLETLEQRLIGVAMERAARNKARAARLLGLNRTTLVEKLRRMRGETLKQRRRAELQELVPTCLPNDCELTP